MLGRQQILIAALEIVLISLTPSSEPEESQTQLSRKIKYAAGLKLGELSRANESFLLHVTFAHNETQYLLGREAKQQSQSVSQSVRPLEAGCQLSAASRIDTSEQ